MTIVVIAKIVYNSNHDWQIQAKNCRSGLGRTASVNGSRCRRGREVVWKDDDLRANRQKCPLTLWESGESTGEVSIGRIFAGEVVTGAKAIDFTLDELAFLICRGGWPLAVGRKGATALRPVRDYYKGVTESAWGRRSSRRVRLR